MEIGVAVDAGSAYTNRRMFSHANRVGSLVAVAVSALIFTAPSVAQGADARTGKGVEFVDTEKTIQVNIDGEKFTEYHFKDVSRPFLYPILGPGGVHMTRRWPQEEVAGEERDHPHHHALWWSHGAANDVDFWSEGAKAGKTVQKSIVKKKGGKKEGVLVTQNDWLSKEGTVVASDQRTIRFHQSPANARLVDFEITITASSGDLVLGDTKEGTMAIRLAESMRVTQPKNKPGLGHIELSTGEKDVATWGKRAAWCDYYGPVEGKTVGVAILDHPSNPRHPTWWHVRDYGLFAANPFGVHDFEKKPKGTGDLTIPAGKSLTFRYRFLFHDGDTASAKVAEQFAEYSKGAKPSKK